MCGIVGWIDYKNDLNREGETLGKMVKSLIHRGPDASNVWLSANAALGHCRLIVVDPEGGKQPMTRSKGAWSYTITYNGELYNTLEIRHALEDRGYIFQSRNSDTEVLLMAYMEWGAECVNKLNGIFSFAIWDEQEQRLFMARDRLGVKPLFYTQKGSMFLFASEIKGLLAHPNISARINDEGLSEILAMGPARTPGHGVFKGLSELKPGHYLIYDAKGVLLKRYWSLASSPHNEDLMTTANHLRSLFQDAVIRQLGADVPVCTLLSGGLDSSAITAVIAKAYPGINSEPLPTFSVDYVENDKYYRPNSFETSSDRPWVERVSNFLGTNHNYVYIDNNELADALMPSLRAGDLPGMTDIDSSLYLFCREVRKSAVVALSGECADEILGGYPWFHMENSPACDTFPWIRMIKERNRFLSSDLQSKICYEEYVRERYREALAEVPRLDGEDDGEARIRELFYLNISRFMPTLLDRKDRMSMAWGLEVRVPFSDHPLVEYIWNIPWKIKNCNNVPKGILRQALSGLLPEDVLWRKKSPYPKTHNPQYESVIRKELKKIINEPASPLLDIINAQAVKNMLDSGNSFLPQPWFGQLMGDVQFMAYLVQINRWLIEYNVNISY